MKTHKKRNAILALTGLSALTIYILACTSFSPDDTKVLYPAFDEKSGAIGMALYDRESRKSEMLFTPVTYESTNTVAPALIRAQWLADGHSIVIAWASGKNDDAFNIALLPWGSRGPTKVFRLPDMKDAAMRLQRPLSVVGDNLLFMGDDKTVGRLDLRTGAIAAHEFEDAKKEISLYPTPDGVLYAEEQEKSSVVWGRLDPSTFSRSPIMTITNELGEKTFIAYDAQGKTVAVVEKADDADRLVVLREGKPIFSRSLGAKDPQRIFGCAGFSPKGDMVWATFGKQKDTNTVCYGLMEIPLSDAAVRETVLIPSAPTADDAAGFYFQGNISHDGKTFAVASTFLACSKKEFKPADCALFLVDLNDPNRKVTRIPIPMPANRPDFK